MIKRLLNLGYVITSQKGLSYILRTPTFRELRLTYVGGRAPWACTMGFGAESPMFYVKSTSELLEKLNS